MPAPDVFAPTTLGPVKLRNRTVKAATFEGRTPAGLVTDGLVDYHLAVAEGGVGLTTGAGKKRVTSRHIPAGWQPAADGLTGAADPGLKPRACVEQNARSAGRSGGIRGLR